jgi:Xaa-Pro aminopeptidase
MSRSGENAVEHKDLKHFASRRERVLEALDGGMMVLPAAPTSSRPGGTEVPYRPDSELYYLTGYTEPESLAVLAPGSDEGPFILFVRPRDPDAERWGGKRMGLEETRERFGVDAVYPITELEERLGTLLQEPGALHFRVDSDERADGLVSAAFRYARARGARTGSGPRTLIDPGVILDDMRLIKDATEIQALRAAAEISVEVFRAAILSLSAGMGEWEIQAVLDGGFRALGADGTAFETIVGSGANGCVLHYVANEARIMDGDLVLMDAGATKGMYSADITRTVPASGRFTMAQRSVYDLVDAARVAAIEASRPGNPCSAPHDAVVAVLSEGLIALGALDGPVDQVIESGSYRRFFPHQTSHWLGLDVHDVGDYARGGVARSLEAGMVLTIEPGLYFEPEDCAGDVPEDLVGIGIRLEDDILVTSNEAEVLTANLPVSADAIQELMA